jgi:hypothetical protein
MEPLSNNRTLETTIAFVSLVLFCGLATLNLLIKFDLTYGYDGDLATCYAENQTGC